MSQKQLAEFLKRLAQDPALKQRYEKEPRAVMTEHGVDSEHQELILKGDAAAVQRVLGGNPDSIPITSIDCYK